MIRSLPCRDRLPLLSQAGYCLMDGATCRYSETLATKPTSGPKRLQAIDAAYLVAYGPVAEDRVRLAGFRLAHLLNLALDPAYTQPLRNGGQPD